MKQIIVKFINLLISYSVILIALILLIYIILWFVSFLFLRFGYNGYVVEGKYIKIHFNESSHAEKYKSYIDSCEVFLDRKNFKLQKKFNLVVVNNYLILNFMYLHKNKEFPIAEVYPRLNTCLIKDVDIDRNIAYESRPSFYYPLDQVIIHEYIHKYLYEKLSFFEYKSFQLWKDEGFCHKTNQSYVNLGIDSLYKKYRFSDTLPIYIVQSISARYLLDIKKIPFDSFILKKHDLINTFKEFKTFYELKFDTLNLK